MNFSRNKIFSLKVCRIKPFISGYRAYSHWTSSSNRTTALSDATIPTWSRNGIKMQFLGVVGFKRSTLTVYFLSSWFVHQQRKTYSNLCVLCWLSHLSWFQGPKYIPPSVWLRVTNHDVKSKISKKWFFRSLLFYATFSWCWKHKT